MRRAALIAGVFLTLPFLMAASPASYQRGEGLGARPNMTLRGAMVVVEASCASLCRQRHNQCRISTRGAPTCDADLQRCLKGCLETKRR